MHKALIAERLRFAAEAGCKAALSMTQEGSTSERNLINAGFVLVAEGLFDDQGGDSAIQCC